MGERNCLWCGADSSGRRYCPGTQCGHAYRLWSKPDWLSSWGIHCEGCGDRLAGFPAGTRKRPRFCGRGCYQRSNYIRTAPPRTSRFKVCNYCRCVYPRVKGKYRSIYCGRECAAAAQRACCWDPPSVSECGWCGKQFDLVRCTGPGKPSKYCGDDCRGFAIWYADKNRALSWRVEYRTCPNPGCGRLNARRPSQRASCDDGCAAAYVKWLDETDGSYRPHIPSTVRQSVYERDDWRCFLCSNAIDPDCSYPDGMSPSLHHVIPFSLGGPDDEWNLRATHLVCNVQQGNRVPPGQLEIAC